MICTGYLTRPGGVGGCGLSIDISAVSDLHHGDGGIGDGDFIGDPEAPLPEPVPVMPGELLTPGGTWLFGKTLDLTDDAAPVVGLESFQLFDRRGFDTELIICHGASDP
jgi:hypothetical protein